MDTDCTLIVGTLVAVVFAFGVYHCVMNDFRRGIRRY